ncbi:biosynthetic arginine decarboxylase [Granulosicoccus antarcticus]|uniref:Arginine decarboxylase n=1 Tax=Granulosicoccus antarcticus IMCC3135 TaxID=1192854 RepID=A0A2Z2NMV6_9GAMM|nr:biosynthetic arginine decarboxylase [Granulosicoccus antarcticus]ASJ72716.1 Biosynthetic arginine decarboxylase [Granulosicoccus antarcticus IMCC3135]
MKRPSDNDDTPVWSVAQSAERYGIDEWGAGYFSADKHGHMVVIDPENPDSPRVSLLTVMEGLRERGLEPPVLLRIENILDHRIKVINEAFTRAMKDGGYLNRYRGVFPIKVNQQRHVIEEIARAGSAYNHGFEAGSKAELLIAMASLESHESPIICNGFKDAEFIQLGLYARKLGIDCFFVVENPTEARIIIEQSRALDIKPLIGVRVKLSTRVDGHWQEDSGDRSIFGLSTARLLEVVDLLKEADMLDCLKLLHAHIGSQIPNIMNVRAGVAEACRYYVDLVREGAPMGHMDMGGGLAVDYDGSQSNWTHSMNYKLDEYCADIVDTILEVLNPLDIAHPELITESGRATVAYSSVLLFNILDVTDSNPLPDSSMDAEAPASDSAAADSTESTVSDLNEDPQILRLREVRDSVCPDNLQECFNDANFYREEMRDRFRRGTSTLRAMAMADNTYLQIIERIREELPNVARVPAVLQDLSESTSDIYYGNFSIFQSLPDTWAIEQVFPVLPIHRLNEEPTRTAFIADITCDSDGKIDHFADPSGQSRTLPLHEVRKGEDYFLGVFLVGAYQETLGDLHNLFGDTNVASIRITADGAVQYERELHGDTIADVLSYVEYQPATLLESFRHVAERAVRSGHLTVAERRTIVKSFTESLGGYTYYENI